MKEIEIQIYERDKKRLRKRSVTMIRKEGKCERDVRERMRDSHSKGEKNKLIEKLVLI